MRISLFNHKFRGEDQKKKDFQPEILGSVFAYSRVFRPGPKFHSRLGGTSSFFGGAQAPEMHSSGTGPVIFFRGQASLGRHNSRLGAQAVIGEARPRNALPRRRACPGPRWRSLQRSPKTPIAEFKSYKCHHSFAFIRKSSVNVDSD